MELGGQRHTTALPRGEEPPVLRTGDLEDPRACLGVVVTRKMFCFCWESNHESSVIQLVVSSLYRLRCPDSFWVVTKLRLNYGRRIVLLLCSLWVWNLVFHCNGRKLTVGDWEQRAGYSRHEVIKWRKFHSKELQIKNSGCLVLNCSLAFMHSYVLLSWIYAYVYMDLSCCIPKQSPFFSDFVRRRFIIKGFGSRLCFPLHSSNRAGPVERARHWPRIARKGPTWKVRFNTRRRK